MSKEELVKHLQALVEKWSKYEAELWLESEYATGKEVATHSCAEELLEFLKVVK